MDRQECIDTIDALVHGVHPITGDPFQFEKESQIMEALQSALNILKYRPFQEASTNAIWDEPKLDDLAMYYIKGLSLQEVAAITHKTPRAIKKRLLKTGIIKEIL